ncbi:MAG: hypothetical protein HOP11_13395 [Saprospiraceae bacterium]|nr:hypothetical protein [Saprospiraceae bacterium]
MNIKELHTQTKPVSSTPLFISDRGNASSILIMQGEKLREHITKIPALLICVIGEALFENEKDIKETLLPGDYVNIEPMVTHWVTGMQTSQLILIK